MTNNMITPYSGAPAVGVFVFIPFVRFPFHI